MSKFLDIDGLEYYTKQFKPGLVRLIDDGGKKNIVGGLNTIKQGITITTEDCVVSFSGSFNSANSLSFTKGFYPPITGNYKMVYENNVSLNTGNTIPFLWDNTTSSVISSFRTFGTQTLVTLSLIATHSYVLALSGQSLNNTISGTFKFMLCTEADYSISQSYVPYRNGLATKEEITDVFNSY